MVTDDGVRTYEWDAFNRLKVVKRKTDDATIGEYTYDALGRRIRKVVSNGGLSGNIPNGTTDYLYNSSWQCVEERNPLSMDEVQKQYIWGIYIDELMFCLSWTLSFEGVLEFSTTLKETFDVEAEEFHA